MNEVITEKNYPIEGKWIFKPMVKPLITLLLVLTPIFIIMTFIGKPDLIWPFCMLFLPLILNIFFSFLQRANFYYSIDDKFMVVRQGYLTKQERNIPYGVIQNILIMQDFFDRIFGIASLVIENAVQGADSQDTGQTNTVDMAGFSIPGLSKQNAEALKGIILQKMKENPIEDSQSGL